MFRRTDFATRERDGLYRRRFRSQAEARIAIFQWLEGWHHTHRHHSELGYRGPMHDEQRRLADTA